MSIDIKQAASAYNAIAGMGQNSTNDPSAPAATGGPSFYDMVAQELGSTVDSGRKAEEISKLALMGKADITDLATAVSSAETALNIVVAIRDRVISAYQQIAQMPM